MRANNTGCIQTARLVHYAKNEPFYHQTGIYNTNKQKQILG